LQWFSGAPSILTLKVKDSLLMSLPALAT